MSKRRKLAEALLRELGSDNNEENISLVESVFNEMVDEYWAAHYVHPALKNCTLCGGSGVIDTTKTAIDTHGTNMGAIQFCICPNGQHLRKQGYDPVQSFKPRR